MLKVRYLKRLYAYKYLEMIFNISVTVFIFHMWEDVMLEKTQ